MKKIQSWLRFALAFLALEIAVLFASATAQSHRIEKINGVRVAHFSDVLAHNLTRTGFTIIIAISLALLILPVAARWFGGFKDATIWWAPLAIFCNVVTEKLGKTFLDLPRPNESDRNGFPSGHAMFAFLLAWLVSRKYPKLAPLFYGAAVAIGWARVEAGAHFPYQVLGGALIGTLIGWAISRFVSTPIAQESQLEVKNRTPINTETTRINTDF